MGDPTTAITRVLNQYAFGIDRRQFDVVRACYWPDAVDDHEGFSGGIGEYCKWLEEVLSSVDVSTHQFTNVHVELEPDGEYARSDAYCLNMTLWDLGLDGQRQLLACLSYTDRWERRGGEWRIIARRCRRLWSRVDITSPWPDTETA